MAKRILYSIICFVIFASCVAPLTSCGSSFQGAGISAEITESEYFEEGDYSFVIATVHVTNYSASTPIVACSLQLQFRDSLGNVTDTKMAVFADVYVEPKERESFYAVYNIEDGYGTVNGRAVSVDSIPYSITVSGASSSDSGWSLWGIGGTIFALVIVGWIVYGVFFD